MTRPAVPPTRSGLPAVRALAGLAWALAAGAVRTFVWADVRAGMISLAGVPPQTRALVRLGFALLLAMLGVLLLDEPWRARSELVALGSSLNTVGRGALAPAGAIPLTFTLLAIAWSFLLAGALHAGRAVRLAVLAVYLALAAGWTHATSSAVGSLAGYALLLAVPALFWLRRRAAPRPALEFLLLLPLVGGTLLLAHARALAGAEAFGSPMFSVLLQLSVAQMTFLVFPLLLVLGIDIALLTRQVGAWAAEAVSHRLRHPGPQLMLAAALGWRATEIARDAAERLRREGAVAEALQYAHAASTPLLVLLVWWAVEGRRAATADAEADAGRAADDLAAWVKRHALILVVVYEGALIAGVGVTTLVGALPRGPAMLALGQRWAAIGYAMPAAEAWQIAVDVAALIAAALLARRGRGALALFFGIFALGHLWSRALQPGAPLAALGWSGPEPEDFWWVTILAGFAAVWALRGRLTAARASGLLALVAMTWLLRRTALMDDPYAPFFLGYGGIGFIAFGILYDAATAGTWANGSSPRLPRAGRVLLYVGYVLLTVTAVNWAVTTHDLSTLARFTGDGAAAGFEGFGKPLLFAGFALALGTLAREGRRAPEAGG